MLTLVFLFFGGLLTLWVLFNWVAPFCALTGAEKISRGRLPSSLLLWERDRRVRFYMSELQRGGYGYSVWAPPCFSFVFFDRDFFSHASPSLIRYVVAHELAHFSLGHHRKRWWCVVSGLIVIPRVREWLRGMEEEADEVATHRTGFPRSAFPELS